jgi:hypothetical protein
METGMGYIVLLLLAVPFVVGSGFILAIATGLIHEPTGTESVAYCYGQSWKSADLR